MERPAMGIEETLQHIHAATTFLIGQNKALWEYIEKQQESKEKESYLSYEQCAELLDIGKGAVRECVKDGLFNAYKFRGFTRFKKSEVMAAVEKGEIKSKRK